MPPALSESESSDSDSVIPLRETRKVAAKAPIHDASDANDDDAGASNADSADEGSEGDDDLDEDVFIVEAIKKHIIDDDGTLKFQVKWEGYESAKDMTWEPEENLQDSAAEVLNQYLASHGGRDAIFDETEKVTKTKKRGRQSNGAAAGSKQKRSRRNGTHPDETTPPATAKKWSPSAGSWEDDIETIDACEDEGSGKLVVYLIWKNGQKTKHDTHTIYKKCPQKMLHFYERHVKIIRDENKALVDGTDA